MRPLRVNMAGSMYHIYNRGNHHNQIFFSDEDYELFLSLLFHYCEKYNVSIASYSLMKNHFHLFIKTNEANLSKFMGRFSSVFVMKYNNINDLSGHLFQGRFKSEIVEASRYACTLARYIHLNAVNTNQLEAASTEDKISSLNSFKWSSLYYYFNPDKAKKIPCLDCNQVLQYYGDDLNEQVENYKDHILQSIELPREDIKSEVFDNIISGTVLGSQEFADKLKAQIKENEGDNPKAKKILSIPLEKLENSLIENLQIEQKKLHIKNSRNCWLRDTAIYLAGKLSVGKTTLTKMGKYFGGISVSAVSKVERKMQRLLEKNGNIRNAVISIEHCLETNNLELLRQIDISCINNLSGFA